MKSKIGVMGSAAKVNDPVLRAKAREVGREIARHNCILVNGATSGMPNEAAIGCQEEDGFVMGISPGNDMQDHIKNWKLPVDAYDLIVYTGQGFMHRDILNIRTSDAIAFLRGSIGTLNEFTIAFEEGKIMGVLEGMGGISTFFDEIIHISKKKTGAVVFFEDDPKILIRKLTQEVEKRQKGKTRKVRQKG
jgi:uncharacterized protein (TIGR00725 family)